MFNTVRQWAHDYPRRNDLDRILGSDSVRAGKNHVQTQKSGSRGHSHGGGIFDGGALEQLGHGRPKGSLWDQCATRDLDSMGGRPGGGPGSSGRPSPYPERPGSGLGYGAPPEPHHQPGYQHPVHQGGEAASYFNGPDQSHGHVPQGYGHPNQGYGQPSHGYGHPGHEYGPPSHGHGHANHGYGGPPPPSPSAGRWLPSLWTTGMARRVRKSSLSILSKLRLIDGKWR